MLMECRHQTYICISVLCNFTTCKIHKYPHKHIFVDTHDHINTHTHTHTYTQL